MSVKSLSTEELDQYKKTLLSEKNETLSLIGKISDYQRKDSDVRCGNQTGYAIHQADQASDTDLLEREAFLMEKEQKKIIQINQALKRIYDKTYGICEICGEYIPPNRLKIVPFARYCIKCKTLEEKKNIF